MTAPGRRSALAEIEALRLSAIVPESPCALLRNSTLLQVSGIPCSASSMAGPRTADLGMEPKRSQRGQPSSEVTGCGAGLRASRQIGLAHLGRRRTPEERGR